MTLRGTIFADAFEAIGIPEYVFDTTAEEQASAARRLDAMMALPWWDQLEYTPTGGDPQPDVEMTTDPRFDDAIAYNLAVRLAPGFGKQVSAFVRGEARRLYADVVGESIKSETLPAPRTQVAGGGNWRRHWWMFP